MAKTAVKMCAKCNADHIDAFEAAMQGKDVKFTRGCVGKCGTKTPTCKVGKEVKQADTVEALIKMV